MPGGWAQSFPGWRFPGFGLVGNVQILDFFTVLWWRLSLVLIVFKVLCVLNVAVEGPQGKGLSTHVP